MGRALGPAEHGGDRRGADFKFGASNLVGRERSECRLLAEYADRVLPDDIVGLLDSGLSQQAVADGWFKPDGTTYSQRHVSYVAKTYAAFQNLGSNVRPDWNTAYHSDEVRGRATTDDDIEDVSTPSYREASIAMGRALGPATQVTDRCEEPSSYPCVEGSVSGWESGQHAGDGLSELETFCGCEIGCESVHGFESRVRFHQSSFSSLREARKAATFCMVVSPSISPFPQWVGSIRSRSQACARQSVESAMI